MVTQTLDKKYRPKSVDDVFGNQAVKETLKSIFQRKDSIPASFLLHGPSGCGKTTLARIIASELGCDEAHIEQLNISNTRGIDAARDIIRRSIYLPIGVNKKVFILNEIHSSTKEFQNAMLETLEEPPEHVHYILCTTEPQRLLSTIRTRCTDLEVKPLGRRQMPGLISKVLKGEGVDDFPDKAIDLIVKYSEGSPRKALVMLDQVIDIPDEAELMEALEKNLVTESETIDLCRALLSGSWKEVATVVNGLKAEPETIRHAVAGYLSKIIMSDDKPNITAMEMLGLFTESFMYTGRPGLINACAYAWLLRNKKR